MVKDFEIKCKKCGNTAVNILGTSTRYGAIVRIKFKCLVSECGNRAEIPVTQICFDDFISNSEEH